MERFRRGELVFDVLDWGPPDGIPVVLLHGFPQFADSWTDVAKQLADAGYRAVAPDQRGYSSGARPRRRRDYRTADLAGDVAALIDELGVERVHLVGHDWGAAVAWVVAMQHPHRLRSLTTLSVPHPAVFLKVMATSRQGLASWYMFFFQLPWLPERLFLGKRRHTPDGLVRFLRHTRQTEERAARDAAAMVERGAFRWAINWYRAMFLADPRDVRVPVDVPTLFIWSDGDNALLRKGADACGTWVTGPYRYEVIEGATHWLMDEVPDRVADLVLGHIAAN